MIHERNKKVQHKKKMEYLIDPQKNEREPRTYSQQKCITAKEKPN